ncbi:MAG: 6-phosphogluconolactonase [Propionibacteriaceae bacterium]|jgi:6-phosphogluconolactonase|nr:6-phosphogluconolactonase [Propionibacteriaceae bacterium]
MALTASPPRVIRALDAEELATRAAYRLLRALSQLQARGKVPKLCLSSGELALRVYTALARLLRSSSVDSTQIEFWWADDYYVPTGDPHRAAGPLIAAFGVTVDPSKVHPIPAAEGRTDSAVAAATYARDLGDTVFDICILEVNAPGGFNSPNGNSPGVVAIAGDAEHPDRIVLNQRRLSNSTSVWFLAAGPEIAESVAVGMESAPIAGIEETVWLLDRPAAAELPYFDCPL